MFKKVLNERFSNHKEDKKQQQLNTEHNHQWQGKKRPHRKKTAKTSLNNQCNTKQLQDTLNFHKWGGEKIKK